MDRNQINVRIDDELRAWLDQLPRSVSISAKIRSFLHSLKDGEEQGEPINDNNNSI